MPRVSVRTIGRYLWTNLSFLPLVPLLVTSVLITLISRDRRRFLPVDGFPELQVLVDRYEAIRDEYDAAVVAEPAPAIIDVDPGQLRLDPDRTWRGLLLRAFGRDVPENRRRCPETAAVIDAIPGLYSAFFSVLRPGGGLNPHRGQLKGVLRVHLGIHVPADCGVHVGGEDRTWADGGLLIFDDTHKHWVWNHSDTDRVVLFIDLERPIRQGWLRRLNHWTLGLATRSRRVQAIALRA